MGTDRLLRGFPNLKAIVCTELCLVVATSSVCQWRGVFKGVSVNGGVYSRVCLSMEGCIQGCVCQCIQGCPRWWKYWSPNSGQLISTYFITTRQYYNNGLPHGQSCRSMCKESVNTMLDAATLDRTTLGPCCVCPNTELQLLTWVAESPTACSLSVHFNCQPM